MARNIFDLRFVLLSNNLGTKNSAFKLLTLLEILRREYDVFSKFEVSRLHFKSIKFDLNQVSFEEALIELENTFIKFHKADLNYYETPPNEEVINSLGFRFLIIFKKNNKEHFSISGNFSSSDRWNSFAIENFSFENSDYDFNWYFNIIKKTNEFLNPRFSGARIILDQYMQMYWPLNIKFPLGWITYFSNESNIKMPSDLGFEVIQEEKGQYVIATREDFTQSKESFFAMKDKLVDGIKALKNTCSEYSEIEN